MHNWDDIRFFLALARSGSLTSAAKLMSVNHSTIARRIAAMEERHGVRLFDRVPSGYELTSVGSLIFEQAELIESRHRALDRLMFGYDHRLSGPLLVTMPHDLASFCVIPHLTEFAETYPDVELKLLAGTDLKKLNAREADIAIRLTASPPEYLVGERIAALRHGVYQSTEYCSDEGGAERVILWNHETELPSWVLDHYPNARVVLRVDELTSMYSAVKSGIGIARIPCYLPDLLRDPEIKRRNLELKPSNWGVWLLSHVDLKTTARVVVCKRFLRELLIGQRDIFEGRRSHYG